MFCPRASQIAWHAACTRRDVNRFSSIALAALVAACATEHVVSVLPVDAKDHAGAVTPPVLGVDVESTSVKLPLPVNGTDVAYRDVDRALANSVEHATTDRAATLFAEQKHAYQLFVELVDAHADYAADRLVVRLAVRATFRRATGNVYIAQTHARCAISELVPPESGAAVVRRCADSIGRDLDRWLSGIELH